MTDSLSLENKQFVLSRSETLREIAESIYATVQKVNVAWNRPQEIALDPAKDISVFAVEGGFIMQYQHGGQMYEICFMKDIDD